MRAPYRVAVAGPGAIGLGAIRELQRLPEMQLVGVLAYSPEKNGKDAGELAGIGPIGIRATTDFDAFVALDAECVLFCGRDFGDWRSDTEILRLLESGKDVITMQPYHYLKARGAEVEARFRKAAEKGGATLHGTGITPGYFNERLALLGTAVTNDVKTITFKEYFNAETLGTLETLVLFGYGATKEVVEKNVAVAMMAENYLRQPIQYAADRLGVKLDRIERTAHHQYTPVAIKTPAMTVQAGTVGLVAYAWTGYVKEKPFYRTEVYWYLGDTMRPKEAKGSDFWTIEIEGRPSLRISVEAMASFEENVYIKPDEPSPPAYVMTVVTLVQAIPLVIDAAPGLLLPALPQVHWKPDLRSPMIR